MVLGAFVNPWVWEVPSLTLSNWDNDFVQLSAGVGIRAKFGHPRSQH